jgi:hypothetical protein
MFGRTSRLFALAASACLVSLLFFPLLSAKAQSPISVTSAPDVLAQPIEFDRGAAAL